MPSVTDSGIFGSWQTGSVVPDPLLSIQEQSPAALLPPTTLFCLFTHQPPVVSVRVYVYHNYRALQPPPCPLPSPAPPPPPPLPSILPSHAFFFPPPLCFWVWEGQDHSLRSSLSPLFNRRFPCSVMSSVYALCIAIYHPAVSPAADPIM